MRVIDASFVTMIANDVQPRWVSLSTNEVLPLPTTFSERLGYTMDLLTSMRGISWYSDRRWDFTPSTVVALQSRLAHTSRSQYIRMSLLWWAIFYVLIDAVDTCVKLLPFDATEMYPVSEGLSIYQQLFCSVAICVWTYLAIVSEFTLLALLCVGLLGVSAPTSWVPMFDSPLSASSLPDFWGKRWHYIFRRTFDRVLIPFLPRHDGKLLSSKESETGEKKSQNAVLTRAAATFVLSTTLHLIVMHRNPPSPAHPYGAFWDPSVLSFFLAQPVGIVLDTMITSTLVSAFSARPQTVSYVRRTFAWAWLLWTVSPGHAETALVI